MKNIYLLSSLMKSCFILAAFGFGLFFSAPNNAYADSNQKKVVDILPAISAADSDLATVPEEVTHPIIRLTPDKSELIRLDKEAGSIIIGNPNHMNVIADSSTTIVIVPRYPGATHFTVLGKTGELIMQRHVIVASPKENYIRIKKTCLDDSEGCQKTSVFYCPDMCHEIRLDQDNKKSSGTSEASNDNNNRQVSDSPEVPPED